MKTIYSSILLGVLFFQIYSLASNGEKNSYSIIEVITPVKEVYDDGIYRNKFSSFFVVDAEGNKIISSGEVFDYAAKIKLAEGNYKIFYKNSYGNVVHKDLEVNKGNFLQIKLD